jgi:hypothetical protein
MGYADAGAGCVDRDECVETPNICGGAGTCMNTPGDFTCLCATGWATLPSGHGCGDVDECTAGTDTCSDRANCTNSMGGFSCSCKAGYAGTDPNCVTSCDVTNDPDTGTATIVFTHLTLPTMAGFDLDGVDNGPVNGGGLGATVAGCNRSDLAGGVDYGVGNAADILGSNNVADLDGNMQQALRNAGHPSGAVEYAIFLTHLAAGNAANDSCVGVAWSIADYSTATNKTNGQLVAASGVLANNVLDVDFSANTAILVTYPVGMPGVACNTGTCSPSNLTMYLNRARARLNLNVSHTSFLSGSMIGGYVFYDDADLNYAPYFGESMNATLSSYMTTADLNGQISTMIQTAFQDSRDLHMGLSGSLSPCIEVTANMTNRNTISVAYGFDSL